MKKNLVHSFRFLVVLIIFLVPSNRSYSGDLSLQLGATAPNAGGQSAFAIRKMFETVELSVFRSSYLSTSSGSLIGAIGSYRLFHYNPSSYFGAYTQLGGGMTSAGPVTEIVWGMKLLVMRLDFATHMYWTKSRVITWSYPLWIGFTFPI